uniref:Clip-domain serine protease n=1 Tax=Daphnia magna TaxID=35525 RepID=A0A0P5QYI9_9CRUS
MEVSVSNWILVGVLLLFHALATESLVFETDDAIVVKAGTRHSPNQNVEFARTSKSSDQQQKNSDVSECLTYDGHSGVCLPVSECYPYTEAHRSIDNLDTWVIGTRGTCNYVEPSGKQIYGVCCHASQRYNRTTKLENSFENETDYIDATSRIVGGWNSYTGEYPFMAGIMGNGKVYCGGSLLDSIHILTAAHCVHRLTPQGVAQLTVIMGAVDLRDPTMVVRRVHSITRHKAFDATKLYNDIALVTMDSPVQYSNILSPVCLYDDVGVNHDGKEAVAIGWGNIRDGGPRAETLQKVSLQIKSQQDCRQNFGTRAPGGIVDHFICATAPRKDSCAGDSGGPLMMNRGNRQCQVGIVSWGIGCATDTYGVYTRISSFSEWINRNRIRF